MTEGQGPRAKGLEGKLSVHGFVLAGGKSSRRGVDKARLEFRGRPMVEIAVEKLRSFCSEVSIVGNREDLSGFAPVVMEERVDCGPAAGIEAGLKACGQAWAMFVPVDVPLVPGELVRGWVVEALRVKMSVSFLGVNGKQPAFCLLQRERLSTLSRLVDEGERRLEELLNLTAAADGCDSWMYDEYELCGDAQPDEKTLERWFANVNTPEDLARAEGWVAEVGEADPLWG